jgi:sugar/nucleoside kinase (ribokinase family)
MIKTRSANRSLLVVGSVALDDIDGPYGLHQDVLGGSASFFSLAASYFTEKVAMIGVVGDDFPEEHVELFRGRGVDTSGLKRERGGKTFKWHGTYADDLATRETLDTQLGVFADFNPKLADAHRDAELVFLGNIHPNLQLSVLEQASSPKLVAADTMNLWIDQTPDALEQVFAKVHTLIINDEEARQYAGMHNLVKAAELIRSKGPHSVVIKRGDAGALLFHEDGVFAAPAMPLEEVKDPTGAGDSFAGGFFGYLAYAGDLSPETIRRAMINGSVMASFSVEQMSTDGLLNLTSEMIQERFDAFYQLSQFDHIKL